MMDIVSLFKKWGISPNLLDLFPLNVLRYLIKDTDYYFERCIENMNKGVSISEASKEIKSLDMTIWGNSMDSVAAVIYSPVLERIENLVKNLKDLEQISSEHKGIGLYINLTSAESIAELKKNILEYQDSISPKMTEVLQQHPFKRHTSDHQLSKALIELNILLDNLDFDLQQNILDISREMYILSGKGDFWKDIQEYSSTLANMEPVFELFKDQQKTQADVTGSAQEEARDL